MTTAWIKNLKEKLKDNRGSALVVVIIAIAFVGTLVAMMVYMVYFNYLMKYTDRSAKNNFYTAETAIDIIKAGLEQDVSDAMVESYYKVMSEHTTDSALNKQAAFEEEFRDKLCNDILGVSTAHIGELSTAQTVYDPSYLAAYWNRITLIGAAGYDGFKIAANEGDEGAWMKVSAWDSPGAYGSLGTSDGASKLLNEGPVVVYSGSVMTFQNVRVSYTDASGYVSIIQTDITVETPKINFANVLSLPDLESYSLVAADGIYNGYGRSSVTFTPEYNGSQTGTVVTGNVYGGEDGIFVNGVNGQISFEKKAEDADTRVYTVTAGSINAISGRSQADVSNKRPSQTASVKIDEFYEVWAEDLYVSSATLDVDGNCFVQDDLTTDGTYSGVYLSGAYNGYGTAIGTAKANSSILINGAHTTLDLSNLKSLELAGHAYVGSIHYNANEEDENAGDYIEDVDDYWAEKEKQKQQEEADGTSQDSTADAAQDDEVEANEKDILMGQSVAVKSDQLMYMVPTECMGYDGDTQILAKNPMTYEEYTKFASTYEPELDANGNVKTDSNGEIVYSNQLKYTAVRLDVVMNKVGGSINSYGASYTPVFRRVNGDVLVYFYLKFASDDKANAFFRDYYTADKEAFDSYLKNYLDKYLISSDITANGSSKLSIAGNMLYMRGNNVLMAEDTFEEDLNNYDAIESNRTQNALYYQNLSKYLMKTTDDLAATQLINNAFTNIAVSQTEFAKQVSLGTFKTYQNTDGKTVALVINNDTKGVFDFSSDNSSLSGMDLSDVHLIIATGDVRINVAEYDGLVFCGGDIYIGQRNNRIDYDAAEVQKAMTAKNNSGNYAFEVIQNGIAYANSLGTTDAELLAAIEAQKEADIVRASDLVKFTNWTKE
jgi:hypothetical protein